MADAKLVYTREELSFVIDNNGKLRVAHRTNAMELSVKDVGVKFKSIVSDKGSSHPGMFYVIDTENYIWTNGPWDSVKDYHIFTNTTKKHEFKLHKIGVKAIDMDTCGDNTACINPEGKLIFWRTISRINIPPDYQYSEKVIKQAAQYARNAANLQNEQSFDPRWIRTVESLSKVAMGEHHMLVLGVSGSVYSAQKKNLGRYKDRAGQLDAADFKKVKFPNISYPERISQIVCSAEQSAALTTGGQVYIWGKVFNSRKSIKTPTCVDLWPTVVQSISMSNEHVLALTQDNQVYAWGENVWGQCGISPEENNSNRFIHKPKLVEKLSGYKVTQISAGSSHTLVIYETP